MRINRHLKIRQACVATILAIALLGPANSYALADEPAQCLRLSRTLQYGDRDGTSNGQVTQLQRFLAETGDFRHTDGATGYFGAVTENAVRKWQARNGIVRSGGRYSTGFGVAGPSTRKAMAALCETARLNVPNDTSRHCELRYRPVCGQPKQYFQGNAIAVELGEVTYANRCFLEASKARLKYEGPCKWVPLPAAYLSDIEGFLGRCEVAFTSGANNGSALLHLSSGETLISLATAQEFSTAIEDAPCEVPAASL